MRGTAGTIVRIWAIAASVVAGVDTFQGLGCKGTGGYDMTGTPARPNALHDFGTIALSVPFGMIRGAVYNTTLAMGGERSCGAGSLTHGFGNRLAAEFNAPGARTVFGVSQTVFGFPGALIGGAVAEAAPAFTTFVRNVPRYNH